MRGYQEPFEAGHVHGVTAHPDRPDRLFAAVEIGGILWSDDRGETWHDALGGDDFHRVAVDPADPDQVFAAGETGLYGSRDGGRSWTIIDGTADHYCGDIVFDSNGTAHVTGGESSRAEEFLVWVREDDTWKERARLPAAGVAGRFSLDAVGQTHIHAISTDEDRDRFVISSDERHTWNRTDLTVPTVRAVSTIVL